MARRRGSGYQTIVPVLPPIRSIGVTAAAFAALGALSRYTLRETETRWQIAAFASAAIAIEIGRAMGGARPSWVRGGACAASAAIVITLVKFDVEPVARREAAASVRHEVRKTVRELK